MKKGKGIGYFLICLFLVFLIIPNIVLAKATEDIVLTGQRCLACHGYKGLTKIFMDKTEHSVYVDAGAFKNTVHKYLRCTTCHKGISMKTHPGRKFRSKEDFVKKSIRACRSCHTDRKLKRKPVHYELITKAKPPPCVDCHGYHSVRRIREWKPITKTNLYCLTCHRQELSISIKGEELDLLIDESLLKGSVHNKHACTDCHSTFSKEKHPVRTFQSLRDHSILVAQVCKQCHSDKFTLFEGSIHYTMLKKGILEAPVCTDCHGFHTVPPKETYKTLAGVTCKKCHEDIFNAYKGSVHGKAKLKGVEKAAICFSCHQAHDIKVAAMTGQTKKMCFACHEDALDAHIEWLENAELHLDVIACASCHSPVAVSGIYLRLYNQDTGEPFTDDQVVHLLGTDLNEFLKRMDSYGDGIDASELWETVKQLNRKGAEAKVVLLGRMDVGEGVQSHQLALKGEALKECEQCHNTDSAFFKDVKIAIMKADGRPEFYGVKSEALHSLYSIVSLSQFYVLGGTRLKLLDILGIIMVLGGISVPIAHITFRILTSPIREANRLKKLRKEGHK